MHELALVNKATLSKCFKIFSQGLDPGSAEHTAAVSLLLPADRACIDLAKLTSLKQLNIAQNLRLGDPGLRQLAAGLSNTLEGLNLTYTGVTDACLPCLATMKVCVVQQCLFICGPCDSTHQVHESTHSCFFPVRKAGVFCGNHEVV